MGWFGGESGGEAVITTCWGMLHHLGLVLGGSLCLPIPSRRGHLSSPHQDVARQGAGVLQPPRGHCGPSMMLVMMLAEG